MAAARRVLFVFVDGVGLGGAADDVNAMVRHMPRLADAVGAPPIADAAPRAGPTATLLALDAALGVEGTPQSGTGQTALLTGENGPRLHGRHFGPWVPTRLRPLVRTRSILARARDAGRAIAFANAYPEEVIAAAADDGPDRRRMPPFLRAGPPLAALGAGVLVRHTDALRAGDAVASEILNDGWRDRLGRTDLPVIDETMAARNLNRIAGRHDLTLYAHYSTDYAGHRQDIVAARTALDRFDRFLGTLIETLPEDALLIVASDHGNIEDCTTGHTRNPALCVLAGARPHDAAPACLTDIAPLVLEVMNGSA